LTRILLPQLLQLRSTPRLQSRISSTSSRRLIANTLYRIHHPTPQRQLPDISLMEASTAIIAMNFETDTTTTKTFQV
jgi:hypothetical protein